MYKKFYFLIRSSISFAENYNEYFSFAEIHSFRRVRLAVLLGKKQSIRSIYGGLYTNLAKLWKTALTFYLSVACATK